MLRTLFAALALALLPAAARAAAASNGNTLTPQQQARAWSEVRAAISSYQAQGERAALRANRTEACANAAAERARGKRMKAAEKACAARIGAELAARAGGFSAAAYYVLPSQPGFSNATAQQQLTNEAYGYLRAAAVVYLGAEADAPLALAAAAAAGCNVCVRAGAHDSTGACVCGGGMVVDVTQLNQVEVFNDTQTAHIQAGVIFENMEPIFASYGLAAVNGLCPTVGIAGYTMGGGWSWLSKKYGVGLDSVLSYTVALPDGRLVIANETGPYSDLFWAMRGAGHGSFGVMTSLTYRLYPVTTFATSMLTLPVTPETVAKLLPRLLVKWQAEYLNAGPRELTVYPGVGLDPASNYSMVLQFLNVLASSAPNASAELDALMAPLAALGGVYTPASVVPYTNLSAFGSQLDPWNNPGYFYNQPFWEFKRGQYVERPLSEGEFAAILRGLTTLPSPTRADAKRGAAYSLLARFEGYGGAMVEPAPNATAFAHRSVGFDLAVAAFSMPGFKGSSRAINDWLLTLFEGTLAGVVSPHAYQNYPSFTIAPRAAALGRYHGANVCELVGIKAKYDAGEMFMPPQGVPAALAGCWRRLAR